MLIIHHIDYLFAMLFSEIISSKFVQFSQVISNKFPPLMATTWSECRSTELKSIAYFCGMAGDSGKYVAQSMTRLHRCHSNRCRACPASDGKLNGRSFVWNLGLRINKCTSSCNRSHGETHFGQGIRKGHSSRNDPKSGSGSIVNVIAFRSSFKLYCNRRSVQETEKPAS